MSNVLEAISKLKLKKQQKSLFYSSLIPASLLLYSHIQPNAYTVGYIRNNL